jgi:hypothetical protein
LLYNKIPLHVKARNMLFMNPFVTPKTDSENSFPSNQYLEKMPLPYSYNVLRNALGQIISETIAHPLGLENDYRV